MTGLTLHNYVTTTIEEKPGVFRRIKHYTGLDRAIAFSILGRGWSAFAGVVNIALIARFLSPGEQGYYYTFLSLVALQMIFELGFSFVILQMASHERAHLTIHSSGQIEGNQASLARLASVLQKAVRWYSIGSILLASSLIIIGFRFFSKENAASGVAWQLPWTLAVLASTLTFQIDPVISFLEGCGKVAQVGRLRMTQGVTGSLLAWAALVAHHGLYSPALIILGQALAGGTFLFENRRLLLPLLKLNTGLHAISWKNEIWPFQWRIALSWASAYFTWQVVNPIVFAYRGPAEAGRLGMSINIANSLGAVGLAWMTTKAAPFGVLVAKRQFKELDALFFRALKQSTVILMMAVTAIIVSLPLAFHFYPAFRNRIIPMQYFGVVLLTTACTHVVVSEAYYLRAFKREPFLASWIAIATISVSSIMGLAKYWGIPGVVIGYFICTGLLRLTTATQIFIKKRREWRLEAETSASRDYAIEKVTV
jgi:hypothetical protein